MSEEIGNKKVFSLFEVLRSIQSTITNRYGSAFWVKAEMNKLNFYQHSGHCYPDLVEKQDGKVIAQQRATLWRPDYERINQNFVKILKEPLKDGIKILFLARVTFDPIHGLSLWIQDIDPSYTLGDLEKEKQLSIQKLKEEGIFNRNKQLKLALLPKRIAVISVETSKGYSDFKSVIDDNGWGYRFFYMLFPSLLQGDKAAAQIISQLNRIKKVSHHFDAAAIIRGGGGDVGLSCYNDYLLAREIATFPLPVLTGIGHSTNETVAEMAAFSNNITPTKLAEFLIQKFHDFSVPVQKASDRIKEIPIRILTDEKSKLDSTFKIFRSTVQNHTDGHKNALDRLSIGIQKDSLTMLSRSRILISGMIQKCEISLKNRIRNEHSELYGTEVKLAEKSLGLIKEQNQRIEFIQKNIDNMSPQNVLKRGYSISLLNGKSVSDSSKVKKGDTIETLLFDGKIISEVKSTKK